MAVPSIESIRNVALVGSGSSGKTTLTERLLYASGVINRMGSVEEGNTVSDWTDLEKEHQHSLQASVVHFEHDGAFVNLIDTPGMADFLGHAIACLPAVETAAVVIDAGRGVTNVTRRLMTIAGDRGLPRMLIINKMDEHQADLEELVGKVREVFGSTCLPMNLPTTDRSGVIDVFGEESGDPLFSSVEEAHTQIIEQVVEVDEDLMNAYFEVGAEGLDKEQVHNAFEKALREAHLIPICFVSAKTGAGIEALMRVIAHQLPNPKEGNPRTFVHVNADGEEREFQPEADPGKPLIAHVFKVATDPFVGKLGVFRIHQGTIKAKSEVRIGDIRKPVRIGNLMRLQGKDHEDVSEAGPGDIVALAKVDEIHHDVVLHNDPEGGSIRLKPLQLPTPLYGLAVTLTNRADEAKFGTAISKITDEDPCFVMERIAATKQTVLRGLGELHLRVCLEKLKQNYGIEVETAPPKVAYKETITAKAEGHHRHKKQSGGSGEFGEVYLRVEPLPADHETGFEFVNATVGGSIPKQFMPAIEKGILQVMSEGAIAGYPMRGVKVEVYDGKHHPVDSKEVAFIKAGRGAFIDAVKKAKPVLLEPFVELEITAPSDKMGDIAGDLSTKRGRVQDSNVEGDMCVVRAVAPLSELQNYSNELKSLTAGAGSYAMDYSHDEITPPNIQAEVVAAYKPHEED